MDMSPASLPSTKPGCSGCRDRSALAIDFSMAFQPIVDVETGQPFAFEALVRGLDGESAASVLAQVNDENRYAFDQACRVKAIETAMAAGIVETGAKLSINFLPNAVYSPIACIQLTLRTAEANRLPLDRLIFEFTENERMTSPDHVGAIIERGLKKMRAAPEKAAPMFPRSGLQFRVDAHREGAARVDHIQHLLAETAMRGVGLIRQVERLEIDV
jgi:hypothetical protein